MTASINPRPWMSVVIATYNSERFLPGLKLSLDAQISPVKDGSLEILAVDGGSTDDTKKICAEYGFTVLDNPAGNAIAAKHLGLREAKSRLVCFLDHDETLTSDNALSRRYELFNKHSNLRAMISAGYRFQINDSTSNMYASEFGDPVSMATYRCPNNERFRLRSLEQRLEIAERDNESVLFKAGSERKQILCEMAAGSGVVDIDYFRRHFPDVLEDENNIPHLYYFLGRNAELLGVTQGDAVIHDSVDSWENVKRKISWRINNGVNNTNIASSGFTGRSHSKLYSPTWQLLKFVLYSVTVLMPLSDSIRLSISRRRIGYLNHFVLTYFVLFKAIDLKLKRKIGRDTSSRYGSA